MGQLRLCILHQVRVRDEVVGVGYWLLSPGARLRRAGSDRALTWRFTRRFGGNDCDGADASI